MTIIRLLVTFIAISIVIVQTLKPDHSWLIKRRLWQMLMLIFITVFFVLKQWLSQLEVSFERKMLSSLQLRFQIWNIYFFRSFQKFKWWIVVKMLSRLFWELRKVFLNIKRRICNVLKIFSLAVKEVFIGARFFSICRCLQYLLKIHLYISMLSKLTLICLGLCLVDWPRCFAYFGSSSHFLNTFQ